MKKIILITILCGSLSAQKLPSIVELNTSDTLKLIETEPTLNKKEFFPDERIFPKFYADGTAQQFSLNKDSFTRRWIGSIGGIQRIYQTYLNNIFFQFGIGATVYASLIRRPDMLEVQTACFFVDFPVEIKLSEKFSLRTGYGHYSAHLADDGIEALKIQPINYAKDYIPLYAAYNFSYIHGWIYGGLRYDTYTIPEQNKHWNFQFGGEFGNFELSNSIKFYGAIDIKIKSEAGWATTQSYQIGCKLFEIKSHAIRIAYTYRTGIEDRGQFYKNKTQLSLFGVFFDY